MPGGDKGGAGPGVAWLMKLVSGSITAGLGGPDGGARDNEPLPSPANTGEGKGALLGVLGETW